MPGRRPDVTPNAHKTSCMQLRGVLRFPAFPPTPNRRRLSGSTGEAFSFLEIANLRAWVDPLGLKHSEKALPRRLRASFASAKVARDFSPAALASPGALAVRRLPCRPF